MVRKIIQIDEEKCNGCGACAAACHEGAIAMVDGKARLTREDYCDGLGDCLPACPANAITFVEREAPAYDAAAVAASRIRAASAGRRPDPSAGGCPGSMPRTIPHREVEEPRAAGLRPSRLSQWPVQIRLAPVNAPWFSGCDLLVAADCTAFAHGDFHERFIKGRVTLVGCPKLDGVDYAEKLGAILAGNDVKSVTVTRMEVPCCGGLEKAVRAALAHSGKDIPLKVATISTDGRVLREG